MTPPQEVEPPVGPSPRAALVAAVQAHRAQDGTDSQALTIALQRFVDAEDPRGARPEVHAVSDEVSRLLRAWDVFHRQGGPDLARTGTRASSASLDALLDVVAVPFVGQADLEAAERGVDDVKAQQQELLQQLDRAVQAADLDAVGALRLKVELELPARLHRAQVLVAQLQVERRAATHDVYLDRVSRAQQEAAAATSAASAAREAAERADRLVAEANEKVFAARQRSAEAERQTADAEANLKQLRHAGETAEQARFRRLAGLDPAPTVIDGGSGLDPQVFDTRPPITQSGTDPTPIGRGLYRGVALGQGSRYLDGTEPDGDQRVRSPR